MLDKGRISSVQLLMLLILICGTTSSLFQPAFTAESAGPDAWLTSLVALLYGLTVAVVCISLARRFPAQVFTDYLPQVLGKIPGKLLAAAFTLALLHLIMVVTSETTMYIHTAFFRETPPLVLDILLIIAVAYGASLGIEVIARQGNLTFPFWLLAGLFILLLLVKDINLDNLRPFMENGMLPVLKGSMVPASWLGEVALLLMLYPYLNQKEEAAKTAVTALISIGLIASLVDAITVGLFGDQLASRLVFPVNSAAEYISLGVILERIELYLFIFWVAGIMVKLAVLLHTVCIASASTLGLSSYRLTVIPVSVIAVIGSNILYDHNYLHLVNLFLKGIWPLYAGIVELLLPSLVLLAAVIGKKGGAGVVPAKKPLKRV